LAEGPPQTLLGELIALPRPYNWILGGNTSKGEREKNREERGRCLL